MDDVIIRVDDVSKDFRLPHQKAGSIKNIVTNLYSFTSRTYETQHTLKNISFGVKRGEFFGIVGRNGSGKSTLLKILAGIYQPTKGSVSIGGKVVPFIELGVGFNGELTGRENVFLNGALLGFSEKEIAAKYKDIVDFAELEKFMDQKLKNYSSGMQVRLAFSVATKLAESDILLIDEVLAVGDASFQRKCFEYFRELKRLKKTVVFVSHDMGAIQQYCDRAIMIDSSELMADDKPAVVASMYNKMFVSQAYRATTKDGKSVSGEDRWGDGKATITSVRVKAEDPKSYNDAGKITITVEIKAKENIEKPIVGFSIKNTMLVQIFGANTQRLNYDLPAMKKGDKLRIVWQTENILNEGIYYVDSTISHDEAASVSDRWPDAAFFSTYRENSTSYQVNPPVTIEASVLAD